MPKLLTQGRSFVASSMALRDSSPLVGVALIDGTGAASTANGWFGT
jgi:hypothetical protein